MTPSPPTCRLAWHHAQFDLPTDWEVTSYSIEARQGRLEFATRRGIEAMLTWEPCLREPDTQSMMIALLNDELRKRGLPGGADRSDLQLETVSGFTVAWHTPEYPGQALRHIRDENTLLRWIFERPSAGNLVTTWRPLLASYRPNGGPMRNYAIFGLALALPAEYEIEEMAAYPANLKLVYEGPSRRRISVRRWGMPDLVLEGQPLDRFYPHFLRSGEGCTIRKVESTRLFGHECCHVEYSQRGQHRMDRFMGRPWTGGQAWCWHDRTLRRIFCFEQIGPDRDDALNVKRVFEFGG